MKFSRYLGAAALLALALLFLPATSGLGNDAGRWLLAVLLAMPPLIMSLLGFQGVSKRWGQWVACLMIPYFVVAVGEFISVPGGSPFGLAAAVLAAVAFFLGLDAQKRRT